MPHSQTVTIGRITAPRFMTLAQFERFPWADVPVELVRGEVRPRVPLDGRQHS